MNRLLELLVYVAVLWAGATVIVYLVNFFVEAFL